MSVQKKDGRGYFCNNSGTEAARELRFSPLERGGNDASNHMVQLFSTMFFQIFNHVSFKE